MKSDGCDRLTILVLVVKLILGTTLPLKDIGVASQFILQQANVIDG